MGVLPLCPRVLPMCMPLSLRALVRWLVTSRPCLVCHGIPAPRIEPGNGSCLTLFGLLQQNPTDRVAYKQDI